MIERLTASEDATSLTVAWTTGETTTLTASTLRRNARDAHTLRQMLDHGEVSVQSGLRITGLHQVGANGVNVHFSDGHDKAIYPFPYLRELSDRFDK